MAACRVWCYSASMVVSRTTSWRQIDGPMSLGRHMDLNGVGLLRGRAQRCAGLDTVLHRMQPSLGIRDRSIRRRVAGHGRGATASLRRSNLADRGDSRSSHADRGPCRSTGARHPSLSALPRRAVNRCDSSKASGPDEVWRLDYPRSTASGADARGRRAPALHGVAGAVCTVSRV